MTTIADLRRAIEAQGHSGWCPTHHNANHICLGRNECRLATSLALLDAVERQLNEVRRQLKKDNQVFVRDKLEYLLGLTRIDQSSLNSPAAPAPAEDASDSER